MSPQLEKTLHRLPPEIQAELKQMDADSEALRIFCSENHNHNLDVVRHVGRSVMSYIHDVEFKERNDHKQVGELLLYFFDRLGDVMVYANKHFRVDLD